MFSDVIFGLNTRPEIYTPGTDIMWTDPYISGCLLNVHLDQGTDLASRKEESIYSAIDWILGNTRPGDLDILDLGCGPGLYSEILAGMGHRVCGVDFSANSIEYARRSASEKSLEVEYLCGDYLEIELPRKKFDLVIMIYTDFGVLHPESRMKLLERIAGWLKPGGMFVFDVLNDTDWLSKTSPREWEVASGGFWSESAVFRLSDSFVYEHEGVILYRHIIINRAEEVKSYHFWTKYFSDSEIEGLLYTAGYRSLDISRGVLPPGDPFSGENVTFVAASPF